MNASRLKRINNAYKKIRAAKDTLMECLEKEQEFYDGLSENKAASDSGAESEAAIDVLTVLTDAIDELDLGVLLEDE